MGLWKMRARDLAMKHSTKTLVRMYKTKMFEDGWPKVDRLIEMRKQKQITYEQFVVRLINVGKMYAKQHCRKEITKTIACKRQLIRQCCHLFRSLLQGGLIQGRVRKNVHDIQTRIYQLGLHIKTKCVPKKKKKKNFPKKKKKKKKKK